MNIDLDATIRLLNGETALEHGRELTVKDVLITACLTPLEEDRQQPGLSYRLYRLANLMKDGGEADLEATDAAFLQQRIEAVGFPPLTVGQVTDRLDGRVPLGETPAA